MRSSGTLRAYSKPLNYINFDPKSNEFNKSIVQLRTTPGARLAFSLQEHSWRFTRDYCPYTKPKILYTKCPQGGVMLPSSGWKLNYITKYVNSVCLSFFVKKTILLPSHTLWGGSRRGFKSRLHLLKGEFLWVDFCIWTKDSIWVDVPINCSSSYVIFWAECH